MHKLYMALSAPWVERKQTVASYHGRVGLDLYHYRHMEERLNPYGLTDFRDSTAREQCGPVITSLMSCPLFLESGVSFS